MEIEFLNLKDLELGFEKVTYHIIERIASVGIGAGAGFHSVVARE